VVGTASLLLWDVLQAAYDRLGSGVVADEAFKALVLARIIEPTSKADTLRVFNDIGVVGPSLRTIFRTLARSIKRDYRNILAKACLAYPASTAAGRASLVLYDVTTLYFETETEDDLRKVGMSKERRVDPQIQVGLLVDPAGFPLEVHCFEGNKAETRTLIPVLQDFPPKFATGPGSRRARTGRVPYGTACGSCLDLVLDDQAVDEYDAGVERTDGDCACPGGRLQWEPAKLLGPGGGRGQ
jgi:hypothetical protein